ncbi:RNI-like protein [Tothia fuscella]|uniref:RNI-like protein n=1 Tax=Tothia fuscella TaxID=1048955 RepID=A0A9P4NNH1_9PEZI|nr:RNI-like protein [Tothia fuscella]
MSARRNANRIRGPQSALTDFLAANNISAQQIRDDYTRRQAQAQAAAEAEAAANGEPQDEQAALDEAAEAEAAIERSRKKRKAQQDVVAKIKKGKGKGKDQKKKKGKKGSDDEEDEGDSDFDLGKEMYKKKVPLPGQLENCELCEKRFTVTPYSKTGPDGGLLCTKCGKELAKDADAEKKPKKTGPTGRKRRKIESDRLDGKIQMGAKSLQQLCIEKVVHHATDVDDLGDLPQSLMERLGEIFTKERVMKPKQLKLFLRPDVDSITIHDCAYLESDDMKQIFAICPKIQKVALGNACQFKNESMEYMIEKAHDVTWLQLYAANLISEDMWTKYFKTHGRKLEVLKLQWLDAAFEDAQVEALPRYCPNLRRLKLELCRRLTPACLEPIAKLKKLQHLSLGYSTPTSNASIIKLITTIGPNLLTLSLPSFSDIDDTVLEAICISCQKLRKLRINGNDTMTDAGLSALFTNWANPPLRFIDFSATRDVDNSNPDGPDECIGLGPESFISMMMHSGSKLEDLNISSCRHITFDALTTVFNGSTQYPELKQIDVSFVSAVDTLVLAGLFKCAPMLRKVIAFGCFNIEDVVVPAGVVVIGVPRAQDAIEKFGGVGVDVDSAMGAMVDLFKRENGLGGYGEEMDVGVFG